MRKALLGVAIALWLAPAAHAGPRLLYTSSWSGVEQIYAVDPARGRPPAQLTFGVPPGCEPLLAWCGRSSATASPDGRRIAYEERTSGCNGPVWLFVARADGRARRELHTGGGCSASLSYAWSADSKRIAYTGGGSLFVTSLDGSFLRELYGQGPAWSPRGRSLAYITPSAQSERALAVWRGGRLQIVAHGVSDFAWSPTAKWIAFQETTSNPYSVAVKLVSPHGGPPRLLAADDYALDWSWSSDGRLLGYYGHDSLKVVTVATGAITNLGAAHAYHDFAWSPRGRVLAFDGLHGLELYYADTQSRRVLTAEHASQIAWSPDGRSLAYVSDTATPMFFGGDLRIATTTSGRVRTILKAGADYYGGSIGSLSWTVPGGKPRYRPARPRHAATVSASEVVAPWPVARLAANGHRIAYTTCGRLFVWTPSTGALVQAEPDASLTPSCSTSVNYNPFEIYDLALAGDRLAFGARDGNMSQRWFLFDETLSAAGRIRPFANGGGYAGCSVDRSGLGDLVGSGDLLVFSRWEEDMHQAPCGIAVKQDLYRLEPGGCPCPLLASSPGPLQPADIDQGRIVAFGTNATLILDRNGNQLLSVPVTARAAQLSGTQLVVLLPGELREYGATSGVLQHAWPLPSVTTGGLCGSPHPWSCPDAALRLQDVARGRAAYVLDGQVHVLRLTDGSDSTLGAGTIARFMDDGLVYANGSRLRLVPYASLP